MPGPLDRLIAAARAAAAKSTSGIAFTGDKKDAYPQAPTHGRYRPPMPSTAKDSQEQYHPMPVREPPEPGSSITKRQWDDMAAKKPTIMDQMVQAARIQAQKVTNPRPGSFDDRLIETGKMMTGQENRLVLPWEPGVEKNVGEHEDVQDHTKAPGMSEQELVEQMARIQAADEEARRQAEIRQKLTSGN